MDTIRIVISVLTLLLPFVPMLSALVALIAVFVGPVVSLVVAHWQVTTTRQQLILIKDQMKLTERQIRAGTISTFRQQWINSLRDCVVELIEELNNVAKHKTLGGDEILDATLKATRLIVKAELLLNPAEEDHNELVALIRAALGKIGIPTESELALTNETRTNRMVRVQREIMSKTQQILKREWKVVKSHD